MKKKTPKTYPVSSITPDFSREDWKQVENEEKYYYLVSALRDVRKQQGLTQQELAEKAEVPRETIVKVESGKRNATLSTLQSLAQAMGKHLVISLR